MSIHDEIEEFAAIARRVTPMGATFGVDYNEQIISVTGASTICPSLIPAGSIPLGMVARNLTSITGCTGYHLGYAINRIDFGSNISNAINATISSLSWQPQSLAPQAFTQNPVLTPVSSNFTGGRIRLTSFFFNATPPAR